MRIVHLTDPHLSQLDDQRFWALTGKRRLGYLSWMQRRRHRHRRDILARIAAGARAECPDLVAVTGDLVQLGLAGEIDEAVQWLASFAPLPLVLVPGNHDLYQADSVAAVHTAWVPWLGATAAAPAVFPRIWRHGDITVIGLNSSAPRAFWSAAGRIGTAQLARLEHCLHASRGTLRCVLLHHPPLPGQCARRKALDDAPALSALLGTEGVEIVLHGHLHHNTEHLLAPRTRVLATASASNAARDGRASYRVLDIHSRADGWQVDATLKTLPEQGEPVTAGTSAWFFPR